MSDVVSFDLAKSERLTRPLGRCAAASTGDTAGHSGTWTCPFLLLPTFYRNAFHIRIYFSIDYRIPDTACSNHEEESTKNITEVLTLKILSRCLFFLNPSETEDKDF